MRVEQNNFRDMFSVYLSGPPQTQHVFCVSPAARVAHTGLAGEEWLKAFPLQAFQYGDGGDVRIVLASGRVFIFPENPRHIVHQFFVCQRTVTAYLVRIPARELCRKHAISDATFYTWRKKYGGMEVPEVKRLKSLEEENARLKKLLAEAMLDKEALQVALGRKY